MKNVIYDCDNTMGIKNRDIDDGLALLYMMGKEELNILGVTTTYGNSDVSNTYKKTMELLNDLNSDIKVYKGNQIDFLGFDTYKKDHQKLNGDFDEKSYISSGIFMKNEAAKFIVETVKKYKNNISLIATGSMHNLYDAYLLDKSITDMIDEVILMGSITDDLYFNGNLMQELNFSIFPKAALTVIQKYKNIFILNANNCMDCEFTKDDMTYLLKNKDRAKNTFVIEKIKSWMDDFKIMYDYDNLVLWDVIAAVYMMKPEFFEDERYTVASTFDDMRTGRIVRGDGNLINFPKISDSNSINSEMIKTVFGI